MTVNLALLHYIKMGLSAKASLTTLELKYHSRSPLSFQLLSQGMFASRSRW